MLQRLLKTLIISLVCLIITIIIPLLILKNLHILGLIFIKNVYFQDYLTNLSSQKIVLPGGIIISSFLLNLLGTYLITKPKWLKISLLVVFNIVMIFVIISLCKLGHEYVFQYLEDLKDKIELLKLFR